MIFGIENWLWKSDLGTFWRLVWKSVKFKSKKYFIKLIFEHLHHCSVLKAIK